MSAFIRPADGNTQDDCFHNLADRAYFSANEILEIADTKDTTTKPAKAELRHKIIELGRIAHDMRRYIGEPVSSPDTSSIPISAADLENIENAMRDCRRLHSLIQAFTSADDFDFNKIDEGVLKDIFELIGAQVHRIWNCVDSVSLSVRGKLADSIAAPPCDAG